MTILIDPPLIEAIFQLYWGEVTPGQFSYTQEEQTLFAGKISASASEQGYPVTQSIQQNSPMLMPMQVTHRFRKKNNTWPCYQVGLGIFTVNQISDGYEWASFKDSIKTGLNIFEQAEPGKLAAVSNTLSILLIYQDAFYPEPNISIEEYLRDNFQINAGLPDSFLKHNDINRNKSDVDINIKIELNNPKGMVSIKIANVIINDQPGLLMETIVQSKIIGDLGGKTDTNSILSWVENAHNIQKHSFETLIKSGAYQ